MSAVDGAFGTTGMPNVYCLLLAGGSGTRFAPYSTLDVPKQFLPIISGSTMVQETAARLYGLVPLTNLFVATNRRYVPLVFQQLPFLWHGNVHAEPMGMNSDTGPAVSAFFHRVYARDPNAVACVLSSDHYIEDPAVFRRQLMDGIVIAARTGALVMFGIEPTRAETGYGYIKRGEAIPSRLAHRVEGFVQKPQADVAQGLFESRHYLWNSGMYVFPVGRFVQLLEGYRPDLHGPLSKLFIVAGRNLAGDLSKVSADYETTSANSRQLLGYVETSVGGIDRVGSFAENVAGDMGGLTEMQVMTTTQVDRPDESSSEYVNALIDAFYKGDVPVVSLDHAVMIDAARDGHVVVILLETGWSDVGLWESVRDLYLAGKIIPPPDVVRILRSRFGIPDEDEPSNP